MDSSTESSEFLTICSSCRKVRIKGLWSSIENYLKKRLNIELSHTICPECAEKLYGNEKWYKKLKEKRKNMDFQI